MYSKLNRQQQEIVMKQAIVREACNNTNVLEGLSLLTKYRNLSIEMKVNRFVIENENYEILSYYFVKKGYMERMSPIMIENSSFSHYVERISLMIKKVWNEWNDNELVDWRKEQWEIYGFVM